MTMPLEWGKRVERWKEELTRHYYTELGQFQLEGFTTFERLEAAVAAAMPFAPFPEGTRWGRKWEYGWFRGQFTLPAGAEGRRIVVNLEPGGESAVFLNGQPVGCVRRFEGWQRINPAHLNRLTLAHSGADGATYSLLMECYAGHGIRVAHTGPTPEGRLTVPDPPETQTAVGRNTYGIWHEEVYQLWLDVETLDQLRSKLDDTSLRADAIDQGLKDFTLLVDFELPLEEMLDTVRAARERLRPLLQSRNGSTAPVMYAFGHSHLDICYQWPLAEAGRKCARTFSAQMALMEEYPEYRFLLSQPYLYETTRRDYPQMYQRLREKVRGGQIMPEGAMWVEADTNLPGGESLIRQFMYGLRFFRSEFGINSKLLWLPDVFGFSGALPQIMRGCGVSYFSTSKLISDFVRGERFPYHSFRWRGIDGSEVLAAQLSNYSAPVGPAVAIDIWKQRTPQDGVDALLYPFGHGDGGGGATRDHLEFMRRMTDLEGAPRMRMSHPNDFFERLETEAVYDGELYLKAHRGTLTSQAKLKKGNRRAEQALREAEYWSAWADWVDCSPYPYEHLEQAWKEVLLNQFHDILPGSCIRRVAEEAEASYREQETAAEGLRHAAIGRILSAHPGETGKLTLFNSLSWSRRALAVLPEGVEAVAGCDVQRFEGLAYVEAEVPASGWITLDIEAGSGEDANRIAGGATAAGYGCLRASAAERVLENEVVLAEFDESGALLRMIDKASGRNLASGPCNAFRMYKDVPTVCDAWEIESMYEQQPVALPEKAVFAETAQGPLFAALQIRRQLHRSAMTQTAILRRGSGMIEFHTEIDWQEKHKLLKVCFPVDVQANEALHNIQFGYIRRPANRSKPHNIDQFEVCQHKWTALAEPGRGAAVLNDCKYGVSVDAGSINLTLLKAPLAPDMYADLGKHRFTYAFMGWTGNFLDSGMIRAGYELNHSVFARLGGGGTRSLFRLSSEQVIIETVKAAEDRSGDLIVRLYEAAGTSADCLLETEFGARAVCGTNLLEEPLADSLGDGSRIRLAFRPFEIKTLRFSRR